MGNLIKTMTVYKTINNNSSIFFYCIYNKNFFLT